MLALSPYRRAILAFGLCILAFSFAMEAKLAWYGPASGPAMNVSAAKALPADIPSLVQHGVSASAPMSPMLPFFLLLLLFAAFRMSASMPPRLTHAHDRSSAYFAFCFSPHSHRRPPPSL